MKPKNRVYCYDCGRNKILFDTEAKARTFIKFNGSELTDDVTKLRIYFCESCGGYHISSHNKPKLIRTTEVVNAFHSTFVNKLESKETAYKLFRTSPEYTYKDINRILTEENPNIDIKEIQRVISYYNLLKNAA